MCILYNHLTEKKIKAWRCAEHHEVMRLNKEIADHLEKCAECNGLKVSSLVNEFFQKTVIVVGEL